MFFLMGMDKKYEFIDDSIQCHCQWCGAEKHWHFYQETELASLFFITVWRFTPDYFLVCETCQYPFKLPRSLGKQLMANQYDQHSADLAASLLVADQTLNVKRPSTNE